MGGHKMQELLDFGEKAVKTALDMGAEEAEAYMNKFSSTSIDIERGQIVRSLKRIDQGLGVRAIFRKAIGFSYTNMLTVKGAKETAVRAFKAARASKSDKDWVSLPSLKNYTETANTFDKKIVEVTSDKLAETAATMLSVIGDYDPRVLAVAGGVGASVTHSAVVNSHGIEVHDRGTAIGSSMETIARDGGDVTPACFEINAQRIYGFDAEAVGIEAARQAVDSLKAERIETGTFPVIFTQMAFSSLLYYTVINAVKADYVQRERSAYKDRVGEQVASGVVTVHDDGLLDGGLLTRKFDGEGVPCQKTLLICNGVLKNFLFDNYSAKKVGVSSTGNSSRPGIASYASTPVLEASNFVFAPGNKTGEELVDEVEEGLIVYGVQGAHSSNPESGEFSVVATPAWKIEGGEVVGAVKDVMLAGVFFDVLSNISAVGNNIKKIGQLVAPWIKTENVRAIGSR